MNHGRQPDLNPVLLLWLRRISAAYEMTAGKMLNLIVAVGLEELDGRQDDLTICVPAGDDAPA